MAKVGVRHLGRDGETMFFLLFLLGALQVLYLRSNRLTGTLPTELGGATELRYLLLQENLLDGEIPTEASGAHTHTSLTHKSHAHKSHAQVSRTHLTLCHALPQHVRSTHFRIVVCHRLMLFHCFLSRLSHFPVCLSRHVFPATCHTPQIPPLKSASTWTFFFFFCLFSCLFSCLQIGNLPNKCVFFRPPTHFSHMSHPTFPIFHVLMSPDWQPSQARWPLG